MQKLNTDDIISSVRRGMEQLVARRAHNPKVVGSSPSPATMKETSFVYQDKRGFMFLGVNWPSIYENTAETGLGTVVRLYQSLFFCFSAVKQAHYFSRFFTG